MFRAVSCDFVDRCVTEGTIHEVTRKALKRKTFTLVPTPSNTLD